MSQPRIWPNSITRFHDLNKLVSALPEDASTQITTFLTNRFLKDFYFFLST